MRDTEGNSPSMLAVVAGTLFQYFKEAAWSILESAATFDSGMLEVTMSVQLFIGTSVTSEEMS